MNLTTRECEKILQKKFNSCDIKILDFNLTPLDTRNGFFGEHCRLLIQILKNDKTTTINCFAKFIPENPTQAEFAVTCGVFKKEIFIYEKLLPLFQCFGIIAPECYYTKEDFVLVFDDVSSYYKPLSKYGYLDYDHVLVAIKTMVKLHAASLIYEEKMSQLNMKKYRLLDDFKQNFYETFYVDEPGHRGGQGANSGLKGLLSGFYEYYPELINEKFLQKLRQGCADIFQLIKPSKKFRNCVCHGDLWSTNIMIKYTDSKPVDCLMIDFQTVRYCPPGHDFMSFIFLTTTREFREKYLSKLQQIYYEELRELLGSSYENIISFDEFLQSCNEQIVFAAIQNVIYVQLTQLKDENVVEFMQNREMWHEALYVDRSKMMKFCCETDENYRVVFLEALQNVADIFV